ncbi:DeoR family transcriptional regulator [Agrilactobacillus composti DSM 18527 = JCM 14202]|uniref:DeoR family transcriptional regulator n=1 Tax=Agrilactobacillus composti DSM 18527 = JCM 14202 TaxID=1423734 RepID=X0PSF1_9LACO|nr:DeoR/GlpR family DNA-binding transcription regulator [Agrilactobacillus composti]KRM30904.1 DeoR family transcriptional regulator [Agrilactobacillus composti DSM 18527 = JCM 14202]GAF40842.1 DeoR-family transcriptional regulator [Agrilactobacillus composti DSM 18527 = JCM 14202]
MKADQIQQRREAMLAMLRAKKSVKIREFVTQFKVSDETIRKDLEILSQQGLVIKQFGKAVLVPNIPLTPVAQRTDIHQADKEKIAATTFDLLPKRPLTIGLDQGSTVSTFARLLSTVPDLTIITSSLLSLIALQSTTNTLYSTGGRYNVSDMSFQGTSPQATYAQIQLDYCFLGSSGVADRAGFCSSSFGDAEMKRQLMKNSTNKVLLIDKSKFQVSSLVQVGTWDQVDHVITNLDPDSKDYQKISQLTHVIAVR